MLRFLVVDDNDITRLIHQRMLEKYGVVDAASNGEQAIALHVNNSYDFILMDINLPGMNGIEATKKILAQSPNVKIYGATSNIKSQVKLECLEAGMKGVLNKPVMVSNLEEVVFEKN